MRGPVTDAKQLYWGGRNGKFTTEDQKVWFERMLEKKWIVPYWETRYGGGGLSSVQNNILNQEMSRLGCRKPHINFGISMLGPALLKFANEEQKTYYLNQICRGEIRWVQGYSEPNAGSDLANLQTKAEDKGDHFLVTGSKVWTSYGKKKTLGEVAIKSIGITDGLLSNPSIRSKIANLEMNEKIFELTIQRALDEHKAGNNSGAVSSFFKYYGTELAMQKEELRLEVNGFDSTEWTSEESNNGREARYFCRSKGHSIEGGTHEVQLNIIAKRVLGLPSK